MAEQGFVLDIDTKFIERLEKADEALDKMVRSVDNVANSLNKLASGGLSRFASIIDGITGSVTNLSEAKIGDFGLSEVSDSAADAVDGVNDILNAVQQVKEAGAKTSLSFNIVDYIKPSEVTAKIEKTKTAIENATDKLKDWQNKLSTYLEFDPAVQKADTKNAVKKIAVWEAQIKSLNETYKRLNDDLEVARARAQELANAANSTEFKDIATWKAIKEAQQELLDTGGFASRAEQQPIVDKFAQAQENIKEQMASTKEVAEANDDERYQMELRNLARRQKAQDDAANAERERLEENARIQNEIEESRYRQSLKHLDDESRAIEAEQKAKEDTRRQIAKADTENIIKTRKERQEALEAETRAQQEAIKNAQEAYTKIVNETQAEYKRVLAELNQVADQKYKLDLFKAKHGETDETKKADEEILRRQTELNTKRENLEANYQKHLTSVVEDNEKNRAKIIIDNIERQYNIAAANQRRIEQEKEKAAKADAKRTHEERTTFSGAMDYSKNTKSINDQIQAIKHLEEARNKLDKTTLGAKEYKRQVKEINSEIKRQKKEIDELTDKQRGLNEVAGRLKGMLGTMFSIHAIRGYVNQISQVRGEFELQQRSLQALLQSKGEANKLWNQTVQLAVKSPFQVKQLITYTKQLAAYRVETEKLHDTTKMLADISAGLGVDMGRLILAFGQVKAANYLRGTELRQFSEAGINILDELARYYSALEGKTITVGQVFERVSKRMVSFADVEKVLQKVTSAGGMFYKMQEEQADTLKEQISNLKDQIDLMLNDIGERNEAVMKSGVKVANWLIRNYKLLIPVLSMGAAGFAAMQVSMIKAKIGAQALTAGIKSLRAVMLSPWTVLLAGVSALISEIIRYEHKLKQIENAHKKFNDSMIDIQAEMNDAMNTDKIEDARVALNKLLETAKKDFKIDFGLSPEDINKLDTDAIVAKFTEIRQKMFDAEIISKQLAESFAKAESWDTGFWRGFVSIASMGAMQPKFDEGLKKDAEQYQASADKLLSTIQNFGLELAANADIKLPPEHPLRAMQGKDESNLEYLERLLNALNALRHDSIVINAGIDFSAIDKAIEEYNSRMDDASTEAKLFLQRTLGDTASLAPEVIEAALTNFTNNNVFWDNFKKDLLFRAKGLKPKSDDDESTVTPVIDTSNKENINYWEKLTDTIKKVNDAYKSLNKTFDDTTAKQGAVEKYTEALDDVLSKIVIDGKKMDASSFMEMFDLTTEEGMLKALDMIAKEAPKAADKLKAKLEKDEITWEGKVKIQQDADKELADHIADLFSGYELSMELDKLNIPSDFAQGFFDVAVTSLDQLRPAILNAFDMSKFKGMANEDIFKTEQFKRMSEDRQKSLRDALNKESEMERKAQEERLKTYLQYARMAIGERAKIKLEELRKLQEIEATFAPEDSAMKDIAIKAVRDESAKKEMKYQWEQFQKSDLFINLFDDMDNASSALINHAIKKLEEFKEQWRDMPHEEMKSIVEKINQLRAKLDEFKSPSKQIASLKSESSKDKRNVADIYSSYISESEKQEAYDAEIAHLETVINLIQEEQAEELESYAIQKGDLSLQNANVEELKERLDTVKNLKQKSQEQIEIDKKSLDIHVQLARAYERKIKTLDDLQNAANELYDAGVAIWDLFEDDKTIGRIFSDMSMDMANTTLNTIKGYYALQAQREQMIANGIAADEFAMKMNSAMGIVGWIVMGVQLIGTALKAAFDAHDMRIDNQIQQLAKNVEYLQGRFEEFEKALDKAFSTTQVESFTKALSDNIDRQIANYERMRKLEEDKKKTDQSKIDEYNDAIKDLSEQRKEIFEEQQSNVTAGILDDALSAAEGFVDAWYEAFKETGGGLSGLRENFKEMLTDLIKKQAAMQIVGHYTKMYSDWLAEYIDVAGGDAMLTTDEAKKWATKVKETMPELNALLENFFSGTQELLQEEGSLSELSKGIQGITETTAQALEALLNSIRFYVADSNTQMKTLANAFASEDVARNPLLNELRQHTAILRSIEGMFDSVIGRGNSAHSGAYLKVLM